MKPNPAAVPETIAAYVPLVVPGGMANVTVDVPVPGSVVGLNVAVAPVGNPAALRDTDCPAPAVVVTATVWLYVPPVAGAATRLASRLIPKSGGTIVSVAIPETAAVPDWPNIARLYRPGGVAAPGVIVNVAEPPASMVVGLNVAVAPGAIPVTLRSKLFEAPFKIVKLACTPTFTDEVAGTTDRAIDGSTFRYPLEC